MVVVLQKQSPYCMLATEGKHAVGSDSRNGGRLSRPHLLENREYRIGSSLDHQAKVLSGISSLVCRPYKYRV